LDPDGDESKGFVGAKAVIRMSLMEYKIVIIRNLM